MYHTPIFTVVLNTEKEMIHESDVDRNTETNFKYLQYYLE